MAFEDAAPPADAATGGPSLVGADVPEHRLGIFYLVWHAPATQGMRAIAADGGTPRTLDDVLGAGGSYASIYKEQGGEGQTAKFYWSSRPQRGFYCLYRRRPGEAGILPDCDGIRETAAAHAEQLLAAGIDHVIVDATNLSDLDAPSQVLQLRPTEVLFEEWALLRAAGRKTPQIGIWASIPKGSTHWERHRALYEDPAYDGLVLRDRRTNKKVYFIVDPPDAARVPDPNVVRTLREASFVVQPLWTLTKTDASVDRWAFMAPCRAGGQETTSVLGDAPCDQAWTPASSLGSAVSVVPSYQVNFGSLPYAASGRFGGHTFRKQWATALNVMPDYVFVSGWNEFVAQPQENPLVGDTFAKSMGLERDPDGRNLFVDAYGYEFSRDIEPTAEHGTASYDLLASCSRVFRRNAATGARGCSDLQEPCCAVTAPSAFVTVLAGRQDATPDVLLTTSRDELTTSGYREVCSRHGLPTAFCVLGNEPSTPLGPFILFGEPAPGRRPVHRCRIANRHFYALDPGCEGQTFERVLGYVSTRSANDTPRRLQRCFDRTTGEHSVALGFDCPQGADDVGTLGFVR